MLNHGPYTKVVRFGPQVGRCRNPSRCPPCHNLRVSDFTQRVRRVEHWRARAGPNFRAAGLPNQRASRCFSTNTQSLIKRSKVQQILATILKDSLTPGAEYGSLDLQNSGWRHIMTMKADCYYLFRPPPQAHLMSGVDKDCTGARLQITWL